MCPLLVGMRLEWFMMPLARWLASTLYFGPPLVCTTMNPADVEHPSYEMHEGAPIAIRCLYKVPICEDCHGTLSDTVHVRQSFPWPTIYGSVAFHYLLLL